MNRFILVAKEFEPLLKQLGAAALRGAAQVAGQDIYEAVKAELRKRGVHHEDTHMDPRDVPNHMGKWPHG